jgi:hypothetical protein
LGASFFLESSFTATARVMAITNIEAREFLPAEDEVENHIYFPPI